MGDGAKVAGTVIGAPLIASFLVACEDGDKKLDIPERKFQPEVIKWVEEPKLELIKGVSSFTFATIDRNGQITVSNPDRGDIFKGVLPSRFDNPSPFDLAFSPDGQKLAISSRLFSPGKYIRNVHLVDLDHGQISKAFAVDFPISSPYGVLAWSVDGSMLAITGGGESDPATQTYVWDFNSNSFMTDRNKLVAIPDLEHEVKPIKGTDVVLERWGRKRNFIYISDNEALIHKLNYEARAIDIYLYKVKENTVTKKTSIKYDKNNQLIPSNFLWPDWLIGYTDTITNINAREPFQAEIFVISVTTGEKISLGAAGTSPRGDTFFSVHSTSIGEGDFVKTDKGMFFLNQGRKYSVSPTVWEIFAAPKPKNISEDLISQIPESKNKLGFSEGNLVSLPDKSNWYLNNGGRYKVEEDLNKFSKLRQRNFKIWEIPQWLSDKIDKKDFPKDLFIDWNGSLVDPQRPIMIIFIDGWDSSIKGLSASTSEYQIEKFSKMKDGLKLIGWSDIQFLELTYNVELSQDGQGKRIIKPDFYKESHSKRHISENTERVKLFLERAKILFPLTQFILVGHSQGGYMVEQLALTYPESICRAITIDSPLKGINKAFFPIDIDNLGSFLGDAAKDFIKLGDDPNTSKAVEDSALILQAEGVEFFTFTNSYDGLVKQEVAIVNNSKKEIEGYKVKFIWEAGDPNTLPAHSVLLRTDLFLAEVAKVVGKPN